MKALFQRCLVALAALNVSMSAAVQPLTARDFLVPDATGKVYRVDGATGNRTIFSSSAVGGGISMGELTAVASDGFRVFATDFTNGRIVRIDAVTGDRFAYANIPFPYCIQFGYYGFIYVVSNNTSGVYDTIYQINPQAGTIAVVSGPTSSSSTRGMGPSMDWIDNIAVSRDGTKLYVAEKYEGALNSTPSYVLEIEISTGNRTEIDRFGAVIDHPSAVADLDDRTLLVVDSPTVFKLDKITKTATVLSRSGGSAVGSGPAFDNPFSIVYLKGSSAAYVANKLNGSILAVDITTGNRTSVGGSGPAWGTMGRIAQVPQWLDPSPTLTPLGGNQFGVTMGGTLAARYRVDASTNLINWSTLGTFVADQSSEAFTWTAAAGGRGFLLIIRTE